MIYVKVNRKSRLVFLLVRRRNQPTFLKKSRQKTFELGVFDGLNIGFLLYGLSSAWQSVYFLKKVKQKTFELRV